MKNYYSLLLLLFMTTSLIAQTNTIKGKIIYLNSSNESIKQIVIQCKIKSINWSTKIKSANNGDFEITFPKKSIGQKIEFSISKKGVNNQTLIIVNQEELDEFRVLEKHKEVIDIIVCEKGQQVTSGYLADAYELLQKKEKALAFHLKNIKRLEAISPSQELGIAYDKLARFYRFQATNYEQALIFYLKSAAIKETVLAPNDPELALSYDFIATIYEDLGDIENALIYALKEYEISEAILDPNDVELLLIYQNLARFYTTLKDYTNVLKFQLKAIKILEIDARFDAQNRAEAYGNIAYTCGILKKYNQELTYYLKSKKILEVNLEPNHMKLGILYGNLASTYTDLEQYDAGIQYIEKCNIVFKASLPKEHKYHQQIEKMRNEILKRKANH